LAVIQGLQSSLVQNLEAIRKSFKQELENQQLLLKRNIADIFAKQFEQIKSIRRIVKLFDPNAALKRGYALVEINEKFVKSIKHVNIHDQLNIKLVDGTIGAKVETVKANE
jgi:exonuclease VII large subunit